MFELLLSLSLNDFRDLAKAVQVEAAKGTDDEYCVAASVLNRVMSDKFPNTVHEVVYAPRQYEGIYTKGFFFADSKLVDKLRSSEGRLNIARWGEVLNGRTDFKGQSMLKYRVESQDPMCHPKGNFYHYHWQK